MNVVIANKRKNMLSSLNIDVIKSIEGVYDVEEISSMFKNFFFQHMILDITAINDYENIENLKNLSKTLDMSKIILILDNSEKSSTPEYLSELVSLGIYNFTRNKEGIEYLVNNPNSYEDVKKLHNFSSKSSKNEFDTIRRNLDEEEVELDDLRKLTKHSSVKDDISKVEETFKDNENKNLYEDVSDEDFNYDNKEENKDEINYEDEKEKTDDSYRVGHFFDSNISEKTIAKRQAKAKLMEEEISDSKIIGFKNITEHAGATTLIYMLKKHIEREDKKVVGIELDNVDFSFYKEDDLYSIVKKELGKEILKHDDADVILIDLNDSNETEICSDVIYLIEPSTLRLNKLMLRNKNIFKELNGDKIVLNRSTITDKEVSEFEYEARTRVFLNIPCIDERKIPNEKIEKLIEKLDI